MRDDNEWERQANAKLARQGMRLASPDESGWYVTISVLGEQCDVWVTDDTREDSPRAGGGFDKFMDRILINEGRLRVPDREEDSPQRRRAARHQDRPLNKIRFGGK